MKYQKSFLSLLLVLTLLLFLINSIFLISINTKYKNFQLVSKFRSIVSGKLKKANLINVSQKFNNQIIICSPLSVEASSSIHYHQLKEILLLSLHPVTLQFLFQLHPLADLVQ